MSQLQEPYLYPESEMLRQIAEGNTMAFQQLVRSYQGRLYHYIYKVTKSRELTRDLLQDIFLLLWARRTKLQTIGYLQAYLYQVAHNQVYHSLQRVAREELCLTVLKKETAQDLSDDAGRPLLSKEITKHIQSLIDRMSPRQREAFLLSRGEGLGYEAIAIKMGISYETVKYHIAEALKYLRTELGKQYGIRLDH